MKWIEASIITTPSGIEHLEAKLLSSLLTGWQVIDYEEMRTFLAENPSHWDYIDERLLEGDPGYVTVKFFVNDDKTGHNMVEAVLDDALALEGYLGTKKRTLTDMIKEYLNEVADNYGHEWKGNAKLYNFSKTKRIDVKISEHISFDERLQVAKQKIDECLNRWAQNAKDELKLIINDAFDVDKEGKIDTKKILALQKHKITDPLWIEAMKIINESILVLGSKEYINFYVRDDARAKWRFVNLNVSAMG